MCVLGLCTLISMPGRPATVLELSSQIVPALVILFDGLKRAYIAKAQENSEDSDSNTDDGDEVIGVFHYYFVICYNILSNSILKIRTRRAPK